jgi:acyl-CoA dehydrogenase
LIVAEPSFLDWPFLEPRHRTLARDLDTWCATHLRDSHDPNLDDACRKLVRELGDGGWLKNAIGGSAYGAASENIDTRALCIIRETLARHSGLADFAFAMQGLSLSFFSGVWGGRVVTLAIGTVSTLVR